EAEERPIAPTGQGPGDWPARARVRHRNAGPGAATATARPAAISALLRKSQTIYEDTGFRNNVDRFIVADSAAGCVYSVGHEEHGLATFYTLKMPGHRFIDCLVNAGTVPGVGAGYGPLQAAPIVGEISQKADSPVEGNDHDSVLRSQLMN